MLKLQNVEICFQDQGNVIGTFLLASRACDIKERYYSFFNWGATSGELDWWSPTCAVFWAHSCSFLTAEKKLIKALTYSALSAILASHNTKGRNPWRWASILGLRRWRRAVWVNWAESKANNVELFGFGHRVTAESTTGNYNDDVLCPVLGGSTVMATGYLEEDENDVSCGENIQLDSASTISQKRFTREGV